MRYSLMILSLWITNFLYAQNEISQHKLFQKSKFNFEEEVTRNCDTFKVHFNDNITKGRIDFLNHDFSTKAFNSYQSVVYWNCNTLDSNKKRMNIGMISILFKNEKDREAAIKVIEYSKRRNFRVMVLTRFTWQVEKSELLIIFSETAGNKEIAGFMEKS